jgi:hypothetical protein
MARLGWGNSEKQIVLGSLALPVPLSAVKAAQRFENFFADGS